MLKITKKDTEDGPKYRASYATDKQTYQTPLGVLYECPIAAVSTVFSIAAESFDTEVEHADEGCLCLS